MAATLVDNVRVNVTSMGTGALSLGSAVDGYRGVEALQNGKTYNYKVVAGSQWEIGQGQYLTSGSQLVRTPLHSSNGDGLVDLPQNAQVSFVALASDFNGTDLSQEAIEAKDQAVLAASQAQDAAAQAMLIVEPVAAIPTDAGAGVVGTTSGEKVQDFIDGVGSQGGSARVGFIQGGAGAKGRLAQDKLRETVSVLDFMTQAQIADVVGKVGAVDVTTAIQNGINYLQNGNGGTLLFPPGVYYVTSTLTIGNATSGSPNNTLAPVSLVGIGPVSGVGYASPANCAVFKSNVAGPVVSFNANLGWGLKRFVFTFTTTSTSAQAAAFFNVESGKCEDVVVLDCPGLIHVLLYSWGTKNLTLCDFKNVYIFMGTSPANAVAMRLGALGSGSNDVALNTIEGLHIQPGLPSHAGVSLGHCDTNTFLRYTFNPLPGFLPAKAVVIDYNEHSGSMFPNFNQFVGGTVYCSTIESIGSPAFKPSMANVWYGFDLANNAPVPTAAGFVVDRIKLSGDTTFYVNPSATASGSFGPGDATSFGVYQGRPCLTAQQAYDQIATRFDLNGYAVTISGASGTYAAGINATNPVMGGTVAFEGQGGGTVFTGSATPFVANPGTAMELRAVNLTPSSGDCAKANGGTLRIGSGVVFSVGTGSHILSDNRGLVLLTANYFINGGATAHLNARHGSVIQGAVQATLLTNVSITTYAQAKEAAVINAGGMTFSTGSYSVTGARHSASLNGVIATNGGGTSFFPGSIAGSTDTGGQFN